MAKGKFVPTQNPQQQQVLSNFLNQIMQMQGQGGNLEQSQSYLSQFLNGDQGGGGQQAFEQFAAPYRTEFQEQTLPGIAQRFAGMGGGLGGGVMGSSGFAQALGGAGNQFQSNLSNLFANLRQQAAQQAFSQYGSLLNTGLGNFQAYQPGNPSFGAQAGAGFAQGAGSAAGQAAVQAGTQGLNNWMNPKQQYDPNRIQDNFGPNAGNGTYNPYTGGQGY